MLMHRIIRMAVCFLPVITILVPVCAKAESSEGDPNMTISEGKTVSLEYTLTLDKKAVLDTNVGGEPLTFTQGSHQIIPGLEKAIDGMKTGDTKQVTVAPGEAYGEVDERAIQEVPLDQIPPEARKAGTQLQGKGPDGRIVRPMVKEVKEEVAVLDFNHPLAGKTLYFDVKILDVKASQTP